MHGHSFDWAAARIPSGYGQLGVVSDCQRHWLVIIQHAAMLWTSAGLLRLENGLLTGGRCGGWHQL